MRAAVLWPSSGTRAGRFGEKFPTGTPSIATISVLPGLRMIYGAGVCNLGNLPFLGKWVEKGGLGTEWKDSRNKAGIIRAAPSPSRAPSLRLAWLRKPHLPPLKRTSVNEGQKAWARKFLKKIIIKKKPNWGSPSNLTSLQILLRNICALL